VEWAPYNLEKRDQPTLIGRRPWSDLLLENATVSAEHAVLTFESGKRFAKEIGSSSGSQVSKVPQVQFWKARRRLS